MNTKILVFAENRHEALRWAKRTETPDSDYIYVESIKDLRGRITRDMPRVFSPTFNIKPGAKDLVDYLGIIDLAVRY